MAQIPRGRFVKVEKNQYVGTVSSIVHFLYMYVYIYIYVLIFYIYYIYR